MTTSVPRMSMAPPTMQELFYKSNWAFMCVFTFSNKTKVMNDNQCREELDTSIRNEERRKEKWLKYLSSHVGEWS